ncbi:MAG: response regulator [Planctomycetota bacterium]
MTDRKVYILVIDGEEAVRRCLVHFFKNEGLEVLDAADGEKALRLAREEYPLSVALVDMKLPDMSGTDLILALHELLPGLKFLVHTGSNDYELPEPLERIGLKPEDVMYKPVIGMERLLDAALRLGKREHPVR